MATLILTDSFIRGCSTDKAREEYSDKKNPGLVLRVSKTGSKTFVFRYRANGRSKRYTIGKYPIISLSRARKIAEELYIKTKQEIDPQKEKLHERKRTILTIADLADRYKEVHFKTLKESTSADYRRRIDNVIVPNIGRIEINQLSRSNIIELLEEIADSAPIQSNRIRAILSSIYTFGVNRAICEYNPVSTVKPLNKETTRDRLFNENEIKAIWNSFDTSNEPFDSLFKMLLILGQRSGETRMMKWDNINDGIWTIPKEDTKANRTHFVPLPELAINLLKSRKSKSSGEYVFESPINSDRPIQWLQNNATKAFNRSGVNDARLHDLRRTVGSYMGELGISRIVIGKVLNHKGLSGDSTVTAIYDRYDYLNEKKTALNAWEKSLKQIIQY
jgi:integrase